MVTGLPSELPIVQAPMAGGPSTPELVAAVADAGGYGFMAAGYLSGDALRDAIAATRSLTGAPFGVNLFVPSTPGDPAQIAAYAQELQPEADRLGVALGDPRWEDDAYDVKLDVVESAQVDLVSFTFGCPPAPIVDRLHHAGVRVAVTVTSAHEARRAADVGPDFLAVQGTEAGGHQGTFANASANEESLLTLLGIIRDMTQLPLIGAGGVMTGPDTANALAAGASAVAIGTALLCAPEAGTSAPYRRALRDARYPDTTITRAYSGRFGRGLANRFALEHGEHAPAAYPEIHHLTRPLRAAAIKAGDTSVPNLWAGVGWRQVTARPAAVIIRDIATGAQRAG